VENVEYLYYEKLEDCFSYRGTRIPKGFKRI